MCLGLTLNYQLFMVSYLKYSLFVQTHQIVVFTTIFLEKYRHVFFMTKNCTIPSVQRTDLADLINILIMAWLMLLLLGK